MKFAKLVTALCVAACLCFLAACSIQPSEEKTNKTPVRVAALKGPSAMGMIKLIDEAHSGSSDGAKYSIDIASSPDEIVPKIAKGELDIAAIPANLASVLYNKTGGAVQVAAINTLGVLYLCDAQGQIKDVSDLAGKTIVSAGKGAVPELTLAYILKAYNLEDEVKIVWKSEHSECVTALEQDPSVIALLPEPFVTVAQSKNPQLKPVLDMSALWMEAQAKLGESHKGDLITGVLVVSKAFAKEHPQAVKNFLAEYKESINWVNKDSAAAAELIGKYNIVPAAIAQKALPQCNIHYKDGDELKQDLSAYLEILYSLKPEAVGGSVPGEAFYYGA